MKQTNVNIKRKLAVCPEAAGMSQMRINKECFFGQSLPKNGFWSRNFENIILNSESALPRYYVC